ncbi:MAG: hypothetical protein ABR591_09310 [Candidatus Velthaea sp.]
MIKHAAAITAALILIAAGAGASRAQSVVLAPRGAELDGEIQQTLDSGKNHDGDAFTLRTKDTFFHKSALKGATVEGHLERVTRASRAHKAAMNVIFDDVRLADGTVAPIHVTVKSFKEFEPKTHRLRDAAIVVSTAVAGHAVSKRTGHKGGTLAGAAAGFAIATSMKSNIVVRRGTYVRLKLTDDVVPAS